MGVAEIMQEIRKLPEADLLALVEQVDAEAARAVDERFEKAVAEGGFDEMAAAALRESREGKTVSLHEIFDDRGVS
jgi:hypothetical protein